jgi:hypothetical protein
MYLSLFLLISISTTAGNEIQATKKTLKGREKKTD